MGLVDLRGSHPSWDKPGYVFDDMLPTNQVMYADPLVIDLTSEDLEYMLDEWKNRITEDGFESVGPLKIAVSPDHIHKANVGGGAPYEINAERPLVDSIVYNERHCTSFTNYIRIALNWGGFPGFEYANTVPSAFLEELRKVVLIM